MIALRYRLASTKMSAAEASFDAAGHKFGAGSFIIPRANRAAIEPVLKELGLSAWATDAAAVGEVARPRHPAHRLHPQLDEHAGRRLGARCARLLQDSVQLLRREPGAQDGIAARAVRRDPLAARRRRRYSRAPTGGTPIPYQRTAEYPSLGYPDSTADTRGGLGEDGLKMLYEFVQQGGTLITEGGTAAHLPDVQPHAGSSAHDGDRARESRHAFCAASSPTR